MFGADDVCGRRSCRGENPDYQFWYGDAAGMIGTAEAALMNAAQQWRDTCAMGPPAFTRETDLRLAAICRHVIKLCWDAGSLCSCPRSRYAS